MPLISTAVDKPCNFTNWFKCSNNLCVPDYWRCDGKDDCGDKSDGNLYSIYVCLSVCLFVCLSIRYSDAGLTLETSAFYMSVYLNMYCLCIINELYFVCAWQINKPETYLPPICHGLFDFVSAYVFICLFLCLFSYLFIIYLLLINFLLRTSSKVHLVRQKRDTSVRTRASTLYSIVHARDTLSYIQQNIPFLIGQLNA